MSMTTDAPASIFPLSDKKLVLPFHYLLSCPNSQYQQRTFIILCGASLLMDSESSGHEKENQVYSVHFVSNGPDHSPTILHSQHVCEKL